MKSRLQDDTTRSVSTLAAMTWIRRPVPAAFRLNQARPGKETPREVVSSHQEARSRPTVASVLVGLGMNRRYPPLGTGRGDLEDRSDRTARTRAGRSVARSVLSELRGEVVRPAELGQPLTELSVI